MKLAGDNQNVWKSLPFLREYNKGTALKLGKHVVVVGAGNTAMDCARAALRVPCVEKATIVYRRSLQEMPAWREEYEEALHDGVEFRFLNNPERFDADGTLTLRVMSLGEPDEKGRRRPVETNETVTLLVDSLITAIGEQQDTEALNAMGVPLDKNGWPDVDHNGETRLTDVFMIGDVQRGPSSIVAAVGTARRATDAILSRENIRSHQNDKYWNNVNPAEIYQRKGDISITLVNSDDRDAFVAQKPLAASNVTTFAASVWMSARTAPTSPLRSCASRTVSRRCTSTLTVTNAATALSSVRGTVNRTKTKSPSSARRKTLITAATRASLWKIAGYEYV